MTRRSDRYLPRPSKDIARTIRRGAAVACGLVLLTGAVWAQPPVPFQPSPTCDHYAGGKCYVVSSTTLTTSSSGAHHFNVCHSVDITDPNGWGGCNYVIKDSGGINPLEVGPSYTVSGSYLPTHPYRRAYRFRACDAAGTCSSWSSATYVSRDTAPPEQPAETKADGCVFLSGVSTECWVQGNFSVSTSPPPQDNGGSGVDPNGYWVCRSEDKDPGQWGGCEKTVTTCNTDSCPITGIHQPGLGKRKAYYFRAQDNAGNKWSPWNTKLYVRRDPYNPTVSATNADPETWYPSLPMSPRKATVSAGDAVGGAGANSGLQVVRYRWDNPLLSGCNNGAETANEAELPVPEGDHTLYLCARDWSGRVTHWNGRYRVAAYSLGLNGVEELGFTFGDDSGYDPSVMLDPTGTGGIAFVQKPEDWGGHDHDTIVEYALDNQKLGRVTDAHAGWACLPPQTGHLINPGAGPDALLNPYVPGQRLVFYSRGNMDGFRGRAWLAYEGSGWTATDKALLHPLCYESMCNETDPNCDHLCQNKMGVSRVAAREVGAYFYLYLEVRINTGYPVSLVGVFLMRVLKDPDAPYVQFGTGKAQLYRRGTNTWHDLSYDSYQGYYVDFCNLTGGYPDWRILGPITQLGNVEMTPWGEYIVTYKDGAYVRYTIATTPELRDGSVLLSGGIIDLSGANILRSNGPLSVNLYRKPGTAEYILFFTDETVAGNPGSGRIESARAIPATATP